MVYPKYIQIKQFCKGVDYMSQINIEKYQDQYFIDMVDLIVEAFIGKLCYRQRLTQDDIKNILRISWDISSDDEGYLHYVAKKDQKIVGVILIKCKKTRKSQKKVAIFNLFRQYGFFNILILTFKLSVLEIHKPKDCYIEHIAVDESMRGQGIGERLITQAETELKNRGYSSLTLAVAKGNPAKHLYDRVGFKKVSMTNNLYMGYFAGIRQWNIMEKGLK